MELSPLVLNVGGIFYLTMWSQSYVYACSLALICAALGIYTYSVGTHIHALNLIGTVLPYYYGTLASWFGWL